MYIYLQSCISEILYCKNCQDILKIYFQKLGKDFQITSHYSITNLQSHEAVCCFQHCFLHARTEWIMKHGVLRKYGRKYIYAASLHKKLPLRIIVQHSVVDYAHSFQPRNFSDLTAPSIRGPSSEFDCKNIQSYTQGKQNDQVVLFQQIRCLSANTLSFSKNAEYGANLVVFCSSGLATRQQNCSSRTWRFLQPR